MDNGILNYKILTMSSSLSDRIYTWYLKGASQTVGTNMNFGFGIYTTNTIFGIMRSGKLLGEIELKNYANVIGGES